MMNLKDTVDLMLSDDYKDRFVAEYRQLEQRLENLENIIVKLEAGLLDFKPETPRYILVLQSEYMQAYLRVLEARAAIEKIEL